MKIVWGIRTLFLSKVDFDHRPFTMKFFEYGLEMLVIDNLQNYEEHEIDQALHFIASKKAEINTHVHGCMDKSWWRRIFGTYGIKIDATGEEDIKKMAILKKLFYELSHHMVTLNTNMRLVQWGVLFLQNLVFNDYKLKDEHEFNEYYENALESANKKRNDNPQWSATLFDLAWEIENYLKINAILANQSRDFDAAWIVAIFRHYYTGPIRVQTKFCVFCCDILDLHH